MAPPLMVLPGINLILYDFAKRRNITKKSVVTNPWYTSYFWEAPTPEKQNFIIDIFEIEINITGKSRVQAVSLESKWGRGFSGTSLST